MSVWLDYFGTTSSPNDFQSSVYGFSLSLMESIHSICPLLAWPGSAYVGCVVLRHLLVDRLGGHPPATKILMS